MTKTFINTGPGRFLYFAYGLNLQSAYMKRAAPTAVRKGTGCLCLNTLRFAKFSSRNTLNLLCAKAPHAI
ncbi:unnamed protein product [Callosobruchus maculatus]|uniref:Uncharacterized protein n=1 Tax=Callosobruchus maculatus TaxID=64391 RepID=A0A653BJ54_CALMS|nr:unnamed protein product [Callosobruchus maculatus]